MINPEDIALYLNIAFISALVLGLLIGLLKGFRRSLYTFIITLIFIGVFFLTVNDVVSFLYTLNLNFLGGVLANVDPSLSSAASVQDAVHIYLPTMLQDQLDSSFSNPEFWAFIDSIGMFVLKVVYTILYFTAIQLIYRFLFLIISLFVFRKGRAKNKKGKRNRPLGAVFGTLTAAVNLFVMIIVLSGVISIGDSLTAIQTDQMAYSLQMDESMRPDITELSQTTHRLGRLSYQPLAEEQPGLDEALDMLRDVVEVYNENLVISAIDQFKVEDEQTGEEKNMPILLFDQVLSINYNEQTIGLREDLRTFSQLANVYFSSDYYSSNDLSDITSDDIENAFTILSHSKLLTNLIPVGIEVGIDYANIDLTLDKTLLYETIVWEDEIDQLGAVVSTGFTILENANAFNEDVDYKTITLNGGQVKTLFDELSESKLVEYGSFIAVSQVLSSADSMVRSVITVPDNIDWSDEFAAFGLIADEILQNDLTIGDLETDDQQQLLLLFAGVDLTVLLESKLVTRALINILSGNSEVPLDIEFLVIPNLTDEEWYDELSSTGELFNVLTSLNILVESAAAMDLNDPQISDLASLTADEIDAMFESDILRASISELLLSQDTGTFDLIVPDSVLDEDGYIIKAEAVAMMSALTMLAEQIPCDPGNTSCAELGIDMEKVTNLDSEHISTLFASEVLFSSVSYFLLSFDELIVPDDILVEILVEEAPLEIISRQEVINAFSAITALGITDFENIEMDESLLLNLSVDPEFEPTVLDDDKATKLFESRILHATISYFLIDMTSVEPPETSPVIIPYLAPENYEGTESNVVRYDEAGVTFISTPELTNILKAVLVLDIQDFTNISNIDFSTISDNIDVLLASAILHATVSDQIIQLKDDGTLTIPYQDVDSNDVIFTMGDVEAEKTTYVSSTELVSVLDALSILDITSTEDINGLSIETIDLDEIIANDDEILSSAIIHATLSQQIIAQAETTTLVIPSRDLNATEDYIRLSVGPVGEEVEFIAKDEIKATLNALQVLEMTNLDDIAIDTSILTKLSVDPVTDPTTLSTDKSSALLASKIVHATISQVLIDTAIPDEVTGEQILIVPFEAYEVYADTGNADVRYVTQDDDVYIIEEELTEIFKVVLLLDIEDFNEVNSLDLSVITTHRNDLFDSAILHATISQTLLDYTDDGSLIVPTYDLDNELIIESKGDALLGEETTYISKDELIATLDALDVFEIDNFDSVTVDASIIKKLAVDPDAAQLVLDDTKSGRVLASKIIQATISKVILDAAIPDVDTGEKDIIVPYQAEIAYDNDTYGYYSDDVRFLTTGDSDEYIVEAELVELFAFVLALNLDDFTNIDGLSLNDILPHKNDIFKSAIIQATISDIILELDNDGTMVVPTYDLNSQLIIVSKGDALVEEDTTYITQTELISILSALEVLGIEDFTDVNVGIGILNELAVDPEDDTSGLDESKVQTMLASKIIHATISDVIIDSAEPDPITLEADIMIPYVAENNYNSTTYNYFDDDVIFPQVEGTDTYIVQAELTELFRFVLDLNLTDLTAIDGLLLSDILTSIENNDDQFKSAILQATISDIILEYDEDESLVAPYYNLESDQIRIPNIDVMYFDDDIEYVAQSEIISMLYALQTLGIDDFTDVNVGIGILNELSVDPEDDTSPLDETKVQTMLSSKIIHATISQVIFDAGEPDPLTLESEIIIPYVAENNYNSATYSYYEDDVIFPQVEGTDEYIVQAELTELFRFVLDLNLTDLTAIDGLLLTDILTSIENNDDQFKSAILQATISDIVLEYDEDESLVAPYYNLESDQIRIPNIDVMFFDDDIEYIAQSEIIAMLYALQTLGIDDFTDVNVGIGILNELSVDPEDDTSPLDETKVQTMLSSKIIHATITKVIIDAAEPDPITFETDIVIPYVAESNYNSVTYSYYDDDVIFPQVEATDDYIVQAELTELFRFVLDLNLTDLTSIDGLLLTDILASIENNGNQFNSAIMQATISDIMLDYNDDGSLVIPYYDLNNGQIRVPNIDIMYDDNDIDYITEGEIIAMLYALQTLGIDDFTDVNVGIGILDNLAVDPLDDTSPLDESKVQTMLSSKVIHATISQVIMDAAEPDPITLERDIVIPYVAETNYNSDTYSYYEDDVIFPQTEATDDYIVQAELTELFRFVLDLNLTDLTSIDGLLLTDILTSIENNGNEFNSAIMQATISDIMLDYDDDGSLVIPYYDLVSGQIRVPNIDIMYDDNDIDYITEGEIIAMLYALQTLGIDDFTDVNVSIAILNNLAVDPLDDTSPLDESKVQTMLSSKVIHATISKVIMDAAEPDPITLDSDIVVPYVAETNYDSDTYAYYQDDVIFPQVEATDDYIVQAELTELFRFVLDLNLTDLTNINGLLLTDILASIENNGNEFNSAIMQATLSDIMLDYDDDGSLVVPFYNMLNEQIRIPNIDILYSDTDIEYITESEIIASLYALQTLGIDDFTDVTVDVSILSNLAIDPEATNKTLDNSKSETVLASKIIHATLSKVIFDAAEPDLLGNQNIIVPYVAETNYNNATYAYTDDDVRFSTTGNADEYVVQAELTELFKIILILDVQDFAIFNDEDGTLFAKLLPNRDVLFDSAIIQATVSDQILELEDSGNLVVPSRDLDENLIVIDKVENGTVSLVARTELINTLAALDTLGIDSFNNINIDAGILLTLEDDQNPDTVDQEKFSTLLSSKIVHATISDMIVDSSTGPSASLVVPYNAPENYVSSGTDAVRLSSSTSDEYIVQAELSELFRIIIILEIDDFAIFDDSSGSLFNTIFPHKDSIFDSAVIQATISDQIFDIESQGNLVVPSLDDTNTVEIVVAAGDPLLSQEVSFIAKDELISMLTALNQLGLSNFNNIEINAGVLLNLGDGGTPQHVDPTKSANVLGSKIVHASITDMLLDSGQDGSQTLVVPYLAFENYTSTGTNDVRFVSNDSDIYIIDAEMNKLFDALLVLNISDFATVSTLGLTDIITNKETLMASAILHATISKQVFDLENGATSTVIVPEYNELGQSIIFEDTTDALYTITYLSKTELYAFFDAIDLMGGASKIDDFTGSVNLNLFFKSANPTTYQTNQSTLLASAVLQATISDKIADLDGNQMVVPSYSINETAVEVTYGADYFVYEAEIKALIDVMDLVGASNIEDFTGTFTIGAFDETEEQTTLLASAIMHRTLSNQLLNNTGIVVPLVSLESDNLTNNDVRVTTTLGSEEYIVGQEIVDLIAVIDILSSGDDSANLNSINSTFSLSTFGSSNISNQNALMASAIMHASFSKELIDLNDDVLFIPTYTQDGEVFANQIKFLDEDISGTDYVAQSEVRNIIDAFIGLGVGDLSEFGESSSLSAGSFFDDIELYLESASFHATISNKLFAGSGTLIIPDRDITDTYDVTINQSDVIYLEHDETVALVDALNELGLSGFNVSITGSTITNLTGGQLDVILLSGSMHLTFDDIIQGNSNLSIPDLALDDLFGLTDILISDEIKNFILGSSAFITATSSSATVSNITFTLNDIQSLDVGTRSTMLNSMIVRNMLTPEIESAAALIFYSFANTDYMNDDTNTFLKKAAIQTFLGDPVD